MLGSIRVLDTTRLLPGPFATWLLAEMGAEVIKVEQPGKGDYIRANYPRRGDTSTVFHLYNQGKRSVALNLKEDEGRSAFLDLVESADVVLDGNRPGVLDRLGCGWEECRRRRPQVSYGSITGFGLDGPYRDRVAHDVNYLSYAGALSGLADREGRPIAPRVTIADMASGLAAVGAVLAAVVAARESGEGRRFDISMTDLAVAMSGLRLAEELFPGEPEPAGHTGLDGDDFEFGVYETSDGGFISLDPYETRFKQNLWGIIAAEGAGDPPDRSRGREAVREALAAAIRRRSRARWDELLAEAEVCYGPVYALDELGADANVAARGLLGDAPDPAVASPRMPSPLRFSPSLPPPAGGAPALGADTAAVLAELGWSAARLDAAAAAGTIGVAARATEAAR